MQKRGIITKEIIMKTFINGEILTAEDLNENFLEVGGTDEDAVHSIENTESPELKCTGIMTLTQAQYDALDGSRNPEVLYLVVD